MAFAIVGFVVVMLAVIVNGIMMERFWIAVYGFCMLITIGGVFSTVIGVGCVLIGNKAGLAGYQMHVFQQMMIYGFWVAVIGGIITFVFDKAIAYFDL